MSEHSAIRSRKLAPFLLSKSIFDGIRRGVEDHSEPPTVIGEGRVDVEEGVDGLHVREAHVDNVRGQDVTIGLKSSTLKRCSQVSCK